MPRHNSYFPRQIGDQIVMLKNYRTKIANYQTAGGYVSAEIIATVADADFCIVLLETWLRNVTEFAQGATAYVKLALYGPFATTIVPVPLFTGNPPPVAPPPAPQFAAAVLPGALKRIFAFIKNLKTRTFYNQAVGQDLGIIGEEPAAPDLDNAKPAISAKRRGDEVRIIWAKGDFDGVEISVDRGDGVWVKLAVDTKPDYFDTEPLPPEPGVGLSPLPSPLFLPTAMNRMTPTATRKPITIAIFGFMGSPPRWTRGFARTSADRHSCARAPRRRHRSRCPTPDHRAHAAAPASREST